jgi:DNA-binding beta-propeller fold protein YncE
VLCTRFFIYTLFAAALLFSPHSAWAKWYLLASVHPNNLVVIDTETDKITKNIQLEGRGPSLNIAPNPKDPQFAYVVNNLAQNVALVDLDEGKQVTSFPLSSEGEVVRTMAIDVDAQGKRLFVHEMPVKREPGKFAAQPNRIRVIDLKNNKTERVIPAPRQVMSLATSKDGKRLYVFSIGQDIFVYDTDRGTQVGSIPLVNRNITGIARTDGLPAWNPYQENNYLLSFGIVTTDSFTGQMTVGIASLDLNQPNPELKTTELQPFSAENYNLTGLLSAKNNQAYFSYNNLWKVDPKTRRMQSAELSNTYFVPMLHPEGKKVYCGANWHDIAVFDADTLKPITKIALGHSQTGGGNDIRFVNR